MVVARVDRGSGGTHFRVHAVYMEVAVWPRFLFPWLQSNAFGCTLAGQARDCEVSSVHILYMRVMGVVRSQPVSLVGLTGVDWVFQHEESRVWHAAHQHAAQPVACFCKHQ